ncbi:MAG: hypothetical protein WCH13_10230 [Deltaproteobacteria bacterium]
MTSPSDIDGAPAGPYEGSKRGASLHFSASRGGVSMQATDRLVPLARAPLVTVLFALAVAAWQVDARHPLRIWPPPWTVMLAP